MKKLFVLLLTAATLISCKEKENVDIRNAVERYQLTQIKIPDLSGISNNGKEVLDIYCLAADEIDKIYWKQYFGDRSLMDQLEDPARKEYAMINYGPWDRIDGKPFADGYGTRPKGAGFYPADITPEEFDLFDSSDKLSPYTLLKRDSDGRLQSVWFHDEYKENIDKVCAYLEAAANITIMPSVRNYLLKKAEALKTDNYYESSLAWLDVTDSKMDLIIGPNEPSDDNLFGVKRSYSAFVLLKNQPVTDELSDYAARLQELQEMLPVPEEYRKFNPGASTTIYACDLLYCSGEANAGIKVVALNLPTDPDVQEEKGTRTVLLKNVLDQKYYRVIHPSGEILLDDEHQFFLSKDAFFWNVAFREIAHGLGVKQTINGRGSVDEALGQHAPLWEEAKCNVVGTFLSHRLIKDHSIGGIITPKSAITTFIVSLIRSERFGAEDALGKANIMIYNYLTKQRAIVRQESGKYVIDYEKAITCIEELACQILQVQATGDRDYAERFENEFCTVSSNYRSDNQNLKMEKVPVDLRFSF